MSLVKLGRHSYIGKHTVHEYEDAQTIDITVGNFCSIASDVEFLPGGMHVIDRVSTFPWQNFGREGVPAFQRGPIRIGHDVWIGRGARILGGATIGNGAIVGAYAVVAGTVPAYHVAVGNPARYRARPLHAPYIETLERIAWWDWADNDPRLLDVEQLTIPEFCRTYG